MTTESLVSGNVRINGEVYTPEQARQVFKGNRQVMDAIATAKEYHLMAKDETLTISSAFIMSLNRLTKLA